MFALITHLDKQCRNLSMKKEFQVGLILHQHVCVIRYLLYEHVTENKVPAAVSIYDNNYVKLRAIME